MKIHTRVMTAALFLVTVAGFAAEPPPAPAAGAPVATPATQSPAAPAPVSASDSAAIAKAANSLGYKAHQHDGKTVYCKRETKVGTSFQTTTCLTEDQVMATVKRSEGNKDSIEALQRAFLVGAPSKEPQMGMRGQ
jgi:hypothetical protein